MTTMNTLADIKAKLERALHRSLTWAEWRHLERKELVYEYERGLLDWGEFRDLARDELEFLRSFREDEAQELTGYIVEHYPGADAHQHGDTPIDPEDPTVARAEALFSLNRLRSSGEAAPRASIHGTLLPRGGMDGSVPQWLYIMAIELWMPAEEVTKSYSRMQRNMMAKPNPPRTKSRAFNVARFVWEQEMLEGSRPPWPVLCERWNRFPLTRPFKDWRIFQAYFRRGAKAVLPQYVASEEQLTEQVRTEKLTAFHSWTSQVLAATVQQSE